jgi:hypothetical protein
VTGTFKGEATSCEYTTPQLKDITPKNSPLWQSDPDQQMAYFGVRRWGRRYCPDILLGVFARDEIEDNPFIGADNAKVVSPNLMERLPGKSEALAPEIVDDALQVHTNEPEPPKGKRSRKKKADEPAEDKVIEQKAEPEPQTASEYSIYAEAWIEGEADPETADSRWLGENDLREKLSVPVRERLRLRNLLEAKWPGVAS